TTTPIISHHLIALPASVHGHRTPDQRVDPTISGQQAGSPHIGDPLAAITATVQRMTHPASRSSKAARPLDHHPTHPHSEQRPDPPSKSSVMDVSRQHPVAHGLQRPFKLQLQVKASAIEQTIKDPSTSHPNAISALSDQRCVLLVIISTKQHSNISDAASAAHLKSADG
ncbi:hypothetical protein ACLOJK_034789, partial [Asimina triloba]